MSSLAASRLITRRYPGRWVPAGGRCCRQHQAPHPVARKTAAYYRSAIAPPIEKPTSAKLPKPNAQTTS
jgi:hypothetical protein